jgi:hypothetical protein
VRIRASTPGTHVPHGRDLGATAGKVPAGMSLLLSPDSSSGRVVRPAHGLESPWSPPSAATRPPHWNAASSTSQATDKRSGREDASERDGRAAARDRHADHRMAWVAVTIASGMAAGVLMSRLIG